MSIFHVYLLKKSPLESVPFGSPKSILTHNNAVVLLLWDVWALGHAPPSPLPLGHAHQAVSAANQIL